MPSSFRLLAIDARAVTIIARAADSEIAVRFGQQVRLRSGGPSGRVVAGESEGVTVAWPGWTESVLPVACLSLV